MESRHDWSPSFDAVMSELEKQRTPKARLDWRRRRPAFRRKGYLSLSEKTAGAVRQWLLLAVLVVAVKAAFLAVDRQPQFMFGDSAVYLATAMEKIIPPDRSFTYGFFVRRVALKSRSLDHLILAQTLAGVLSCLALAYILARFFAGCRLLLFGVALLSAAEPIQLVFERQMMTETPALLVLALTVGAALSYLARPRLSTLLGFHLAAIILVSFRTGAVLYVAGAAFFLPGLAWLHDQGKLGAQPDSSPRRSFAVAHLGFSLLCFVALHGGYRQWYGNLSNGPAAYIQEGGFFKLAAWAPILTPQAAVDAQSAALLATLDEPGQRRLIVRGYHRWGPEGLVQRLKRLYGDRLEANSVANRIANRAALAAPWRLLELTWKSYLGYWNLKVADCPVLLRDPLPAEFVRWIRERFDQNAASWGRQWTLTERYYRRSGLWFCLILLGPALGIAFLPLVAARRRAAALFVAWATASILLPYCLVNTGWSFRHLHQNGWLFLLTLFILLAELSRRVGPPSRSGN